MFFKKKGNIAWLHAKIKQNESNWLQPVNILESILIRLRGKEKALHLADILTLIKFLKQNKIWFRRAAFFLIIWNYADFETQSCFRIDIRFIICSGH